MKKKSPQKNKTRRRDRNPCRGNARMSSPLDDYDYCLYIRESALRRSCRSYALIFCSFFLTIKLDQKELS